MATKITMDHVEAHEKLTGRLFWKRVGATGYNDAGNVKDYVDATTTSLVTRARSSDGARYVNDEQTDVRHEAFTFLLDERDANQEILLKQGRQLSDETQAASEGETATLSSVISNKWYPIGAYFIQNVAVNGTLSGLLIEGTHYDLDKENGRIKLKTITDGENITILFDEPAITLEKFETQYDPNFYCDFIIEEHNQFSQMFLRRAAFRGFLNVVEFPSQTGDFGTYRVKVTAAGPITWQKRTVGSELALPTASGEGAGRSSSSNSSSSSSSGHSSSSSSS